MFPPEMTAAIAVRHLATARDQDRICLLIDSSAIGGIERHAATLARGLRRLGFDARILLLANHGNNPWLTQLGEAGIPYDTLGGRIADLLSFLRQRDTALLHTHGYKAGILGRIAAWVMGVPVVSTFHAGEAGAFPVSLYQRADQWSSFLATRVCVSTQIAQRLPFSSAVISNFVEIPASVPAAPLPAVIGFVGRLSPEKGPEVFCKLSTRNSSQVEWHIYGDGPMRADLQNLYGKRIVFHGVVTDTSQVWRKLGLLVISSYAEGLPMVALEALAAGIPVAAASVGALPDIISHGKNGWLFEAGDVEALNRIVDEWSARLASNGAALREAGWCTARDRFGIDKGVKRTLAAYRTAGFKSVRRSR
jgi:glycosyltransferase involved in cell wall biosynthesis